jgi:hypothetical protein
MALGRGFREPVDRPLVILFGPRAFLIVAHAQIKLRFGVSRVVAFVKIRNSSFAGLFRR